METRRTSTGNRRPPIIEIASVVFFVFGLAVWLHESSLIAAGFRVLADPDPGDTIIGLAGLAVVVGGTGLAALALAVPLALKGKRLPKWFHIATVASPATAVMLGVFFFLSSFLK